MSLDLERIKENYSKYDDSKIEYIAKNEVLYLEKEVVLILEDEIKKRGLDLNLIKEIKDNTNEITQEEYGELFALIISSPCPYCGQSKYYLIGTIIYETVGFIYLYNHKEVLIISCMECANSKINTSLITTLLLGWWNIISFFKTPFTLYKILTSKKNREYKSNIAITNFILIHLKELRNLENEVDLFKLIRNSNKY